jgi:hypothetical protein
VHDMGRHDWQAGPGRVRGPVSTTGCRRERGGRGSAASRHRHAGPGSTVPGSVVQMNSNISNLIQTCPNGLDPNRTFPDSKNLK